MLIEYVGRLPGILVAVLLLSLSAPLAELSPVSASRLQQAATPTPGATIFVSQVSYAPLPQPDRLPQDVAGVVIDRAGVGLKGIPMKATAPGFEAVTTTMDNGIFHFSLNAGSFTIQPTNLPSQPASVSVDGRRRIGVEFRERLRELSTPTAVIEPTATATPTSTPAPPTSTSTTTPTPTPLPTIAPPVIVTLSPSPTGTSAPRRPSPTPVLPSGAPSQVNPTPWLYAFLAGICFALVVFGIWLLITILRRRSRE